MIDLSKYLASWKAYYSHIDWGVLVCAGVACLAIILIILIVGRGCLSFLLVCAIVVVFPFALHTGAFVSRSAARPELPETILAERYGLREGTLSCASIGSGRAVNLEVGHHGMRDADYECTARTTKGEWVRWTLVVRSPKAGFFDDRGHAIKPVESR